MKKNISCVILAGGKSSRMGSDKSLLPFGGFDTMIEYQLNKFQNYFQKIYVSTKSRDKFNFKANFIEDIDYFKQSSPLIAFFSILKQIDTEYVFIISVDSPFSGINQFNKLYNMIDKNFEAIVAKSPKYTHNTCAIYKKTIIPIIKKMLQNDNHKLKFLLDSINTKYVNFKDEKNFINMNYQKDYQKCLKIYFRMNESKKG